MCHSCLPDGFTPRKSKAITRAAMLICAVYKEHTAGGEGHIVFDDWNIENHSINFCLAQPDIDEVTKNALELFKTLSLAGRFSALLESERIPLVSGVN